VQEAVVDGGSDGAAAERGAELAVDRHVWHFMVLRERYSRSAIPAI